MEQRASTSTPTPQPRTSPRAAAAAVEQPSWGDVPDNILVRVSAFLPCRADRVHMACVNRLWNAAVRGLRRPPPPVLPPLPPLPPQLPWLIFPSTAAPTFYSAATGRHHRLCRLPPDVRAARCCGSGGGGWLVLALGPRHAHALYNLDTRRRVPLPRAFATPADDTEVPLVVRAAALSAPPSAAGGPYAVAAIVLVAERSTAAFWTEGSESWFSSGPLLTARPQDVIFHGDAFFFVTSREDVVAFRPAYGPNNNVTLARLDFDMQQRPDYGDDAGFVGGLGTMRRYLVESRGSLLMVVRYVYNETGTEVIRVFGFRVLSPLPNDQRPRATWEHLGNELDGRMLFLGQGCSRSFEVAHYIGGFEESMIYYLDDGLVTVPTADGSRRYTFADMGRYSMEEVTTTPWPPGHPTNSDNAPPTWWLH